VSSAHNHPKLLKPQQWLIGLIEKECSVALCLSKTTQPRTAFFRKEKRSEATLRQRKNKFLAFIHQPG